MNKTLLLLLLFCLAPIAQANQPDKAFWLSIEVLVFKQSDVQQQKINEYFSGIVIDDLSQAIGPISESESISNWLAVNLNAYPMAFSQHYLALEVPNAVPSIYKRNLFKNLIDISSGLTPFVLLPKSQLQLLDSEKALNRYDAVLYHEAWIQPVFNKRQVKPVSIIAERTDSQEQNSLVGTLELTYSRFAHINVDLRLIEKQQSTTLNPNTTDTLEYFLDSSLWQSAMPVMFQAPHQYAKTYRLKSDTRVKLNKVQYIDHPILGAFVLVKKHPIFNSEHVEITDAQS